MVPLLGETVQLWQLKEKCALMPRHMYEYFSGHTAWMSRLVFSAVELTSARNLTLLRLMPSGTKASRSNTAVSTAALPLGAESADGRHEAKVVLYKFYIRQAKDAEWAEPVLLTLHGERRAVRNL